jgi:hypothetical protein
MKTRILIIAITVAAIFACNGRPSDPEGAGENITIEQQPLIEDEKFERTDSVEFIYYPDPVKQKEYKFGRSTSPDLINLLVKDLKGSEIKGAECAHYKKLYLFDNGDVFKTIYVSDTCNYLAYAVNGQQQFRALSTDTRKRLEQEFEKVMNEGR